ncbi:UNVERIFIED_CONTAM: hypothetical protein Sradi_0672600 [Sesamum radiatum]|uniref:Reverse transcriptase n=1 Tax=Sesamum radiatum TaxID=300843 RepID=A0AAW2VRP0_SESRA
MKSFSKSARDLKVLEDHFTELETGMLGIKEHQELERVHRQIEESHVREMIKWQQRSKIYWLKEGDGNTKFFHSYASVRRRQNFISRLKDDEGVWRDAKADIHGVLLQYFRQIFSFNRPVDIVMNKALSCLVQQAERTGHLVGVKIAEQAPTVSHLLFAAQAMEVRRILEMYARASGQWVNFQKSCMTLSGRVAKSELHHLLGIQRVKWIAQLDRYLELLVVGGRSRSEMFNNIKERTVERIVGWNSKLLSQAGKGVMIASVIQALPTYVMSCFKLPLFFLRSIESSATGFCLHCRGEKGVHLVAWHNLCRPKKDGGLGFRRMQEFNIVLLAKQ